MIASHTWRYASEDSRHADRKALDSSRGESLWECERCGTLLIDKSEPPLEVLVHKDGGYGRPGYPLDCLEIVVHKMQSS